MAERLGGQMYNFAQTVLWTHLFRYHEKNTIMFDDLRRNFVMNPENGLKIRPFRKAHLNRDSDTELVDLTRYLLAIAGLTDEVTTNTLMIN